MRETRNENQVSRSGFSLTLFAAAAFLLGTFSVGFAGAAQVWEKVEISLYAGKTYENPYKEVEVWVDLKGPAAAVQCKEREKIAALRWVSTSTLLADINFMVQLLSFDIINYAYWQKQHWEQVVWPTSPI